MTDKIILNLISAEYERHILIFDEDKIINRIDYLVILKSRGFITVTYNDVEEFRFLYESKIKGSNEKWAVVVLDDIYVPYDVRKEMYNSSLSWSNLFPKLNNKALQRKNIDFDLLSLAYENLFENCFSYEKTNRFIDKIVFGKSNLHNFCRILKEEIRNKFTSGALAFNDWFDIAKKKGRIEYYSAKNDEILDLNFIEEAFKTFILEQYNTLSGITSKLSPVILSKVLEHITSGNAKSALIVMDGMSIFDFEIISKEFQNIQYEYNCCYALIPTTTSISRQCLLSGKYPVQLDNPFSVAKEESEFKKAAEKLGYKQNQISYERGYEINLSPAVKLVSVIINDIDDLVHNQLQGRNGMLNDVTYYAKSGKLQQIVDDLYSKGFQVYITSDHGNTLCKGIGKPKGIGVEVETKSKRMMVLKDFADKEKYLTREDTIQYPGYYLDKQYEYFICETGVSYDVSNSVVMTHGGISIDEVIVPFIKVKAVQHD